MSDQNNHKKISPALLVFDGIFLILIILLAFAIYNANKKPVDNKKGSDEIVYEDSIKNIDLIAKAAIVYDLKNNKIIYSKNQSAQLPLASITKIMTALTAYDLLPKDSKITIRKEFLNEEGDSGLSPGESWKMKDLLDFSLVVSSNDGARAVASVIGSQISDNKDYDIGRKDFVKKMNEEAKKIGLNQTYFINESGLDEENKSGGYGSAEDVAKMIKYILKNNPDILEATKYQKLSINSDDKYHQAKNTNLSINKIPGLIASKTGYTALAGGNLVIAFDPSMDRPIIAVVLGSTEQGRFSDIENLVKESINYISSGN